MQMNHRRRRRRRHFCCIYRPLSADGSRDHIRAAIPEFRPDAFFLFCFEYANLIGGPQDGAQVAAILWSV